jgi:rhamnosyltransferase subunit B
VARVLLGWELGAGLGHAARLRGVAERLIAEGHAVAVALQRIDAAERLPAGCQVFQAPIWPRLLGSVAPPDGTAPATLGDILYRLGLDRPESFAGLIAGWDTILKSARPDVVVADFAPALLAASRGRVPTILAGNGFDAVPPHLERFPSLTGQNAVYDESGMLADVQAVLARSGRSLPDRLPALFTADRVLAGSFAELDPYGSWRRTPVCAPSVLPPIGENGRGDELFVYGAGPLLRSRPLIDGLIRARIPIRAYFPEASVAQRRELEAAGFRVEEAALPFAEIARCARVVMSHGGLGFASSALAAGVPQIVIHYDLEKRLTGEAVTRLRLGGHVALNAIDPGAFAGSLREFFADESFQRRAREAAPGFRARLTPAQEDLVRDAVAELAG